MSKRNWNSTVQSFVQSWRNYFKRMGAVDSNIIIDDIYNLGGSSSNLTNNTNLYLSDLDPEISDTVRDIVATYDETIKDRDIILEKSRALFETTVVQTMVDVSLDDGFNNFKEDKDFVISYEPDPEDLENLGEDFVKEIQKEIDDFIEKSGLKDLVADIIPEVIRDGEHALALRVEPGKGVTGINDDIDVKATLPYCRGNTLAFVIEKTIEKKGFSEQERLRFYKPDNIVFFRLNHFNKKRIKLDCLNSKVKKCFKDKLGLEIPKYIRICLPLYYSALDDIETLQTMEKLSVAQDFVNLLRGQVIGLGVPANTTSEDAKKAMREYERHLNEIKNVLGSFKDMSVDDLIGLASERKLLPLFGDGKGSLTPIDLAGANKVAESRDSVANQRNLVALTTGFPSYYFTTAEQPQEKSTAIKLYSRYTKKLSGLQVCAADGTQEIVHLHLQAKNKNIKKSNIKVKFKALTNGDVLDDVDVMVATITGLADMYDALEKIASSENNNLVIDSGRLQKMWDTYTSNLVNISGLLKRDMDKFDKDNLDVSDFDGLTTSSRTREERPSSIMQKSEPEQETEIPSEQEAEIDQANDNAITDFKNATEVES